MGRVQMVCVASTWKRAKGGLGEPLPVPLDSYTPEIGAEDNVFDSLGWARIQKDVS
jgi:hypothetical protein